MNPSFDWISILLLAGAGHGVLLAITLLNIHRGNRIANRIMAAILFIFAADMMLHTLAYTEHILYFPHLSKLEPPLTFLLAPLFYFYVRALTGDQFGFTRKEALHFAPALVCVILLAPHYLQPADVKIQHFLLDHAKQCWQCVVIYWLILAQLFGYIVAIARLLRRHRERIQSSFSSLEKINLSWLRNLLLVVILTWLAALIMQLVHPTIENANYVWLLVAIAIYWMGYMGLHQPEIFFGATNEKAAHKRYGKSTLTPEKADAYLQKLKGFMAKVKPYLRSDLTLPLLARELNISTHHLSQIINEKLGQNFFEFINCQRVEEAKRRIVDPAYVNMNLAGIGLEVASIRFHRSTPHSNGTRG